MRELIVLGTGNAQAVNYYNTCFALRLDEGLFLVDAGGGNGILTQLRKAEIDFLDIHHMLVTHAHSDHLLGAIWVIRMIGQNIKNYDGDFTIYAHDEAASAIKTICSLTLPGSVLKLIGDRINIKEITNGESLEVLDESFTFFDICSGKMKQFGFSARFRDGMIFTCLGDEPFSEGCRVYAEGSTWLTSEAFCLYRERDIFKPYEKHHSTVREACETAAALSAANLVLWHTEDSHDSKRKKLYQDEGRAYYDGNLIVPEDLDVIQLGHRLSDSKLL